MELFTMKYEHHKHRMALEMLSAERGSAAIQIGCLAHRRDDATGEATPDGLILGGTIPVKELTRWAARKGYLNWQRKDLAPAPETTDSKPAEAPTETEKPAHVEKKTTPAKPAKKPTRAPKEQKPKRAAKKATHR